VQHHGGRRRADQPRTRAHEEIAIERDQDRRGQERADERFEPRGRHVRVAIEARDEVAGAVPREEAHRQPEQVTEEIRLHRGRGAHADPERQEVVAEIERAFQHADAHVRQAQDDDRPEAIVPRSDAEPV
jgi:hypothetical protein